MNLLSQFPSFKMKAVPEHKPGETASNAIRPHHTPSLLEQLGINPSRNSAELWCRECALAVKASKEHRLGVKVSR